ncbi:hypothetical protein BKA93DRAFT_338436 [Sparassis latifolia]
MRLRESHKVRFLSSERVSDGTLNRHGCHIFIHLRVRGGKSSLQIRNNSVRRRSSQQRTARMAGGSRFGQKQSCARWLHGSVNQHAALYRSLISVANKIRKTFFCWHDDAVCQVSMLSNFLWACCLPVFPIHRTHPELYYAKRTTTCCCEVSAFNWLCTTGTNLQFFCILPYFKGLNCTCSLKVRFFELGRSESAGAYRRSHTVTAHES